MRVREVNKIPMITQSSKEMKTCRKDGSLSIRAFWASGQAEATLGKSHVKLPEGGLIIKCKMFIVISTI